MALTTIQAVYDEARHALEAGKDERAIGLSEHLLESFPYFLEAYRILGESHLNRQELGEAATAFERVLRSDPENIPVHVGLGVTYERQGKLEQAIQEFERAFEIKPDLAELRNQVLRLYGEAWGKDYAHLRLKKAGLARLYMRSHRYDKAVQELQDVLSQEPQRLDAQVALAEALWRNGQEHEAADLCRSILTNDPNVLKANLILGYLLLAAGDPQGRSLWQHAQQLEPTLTTARTLFGATLPPVESINLGIAEFDEQVWRDAKDAKVRAEREEREKVERERREKEERERAAMLEPVAAEPVAASSSWLDSVAAPPAATSKSSAGADDFLMSLLLGGGSSAPSTPTPTMTPPPAEPVETDFSIDDLGIDIEPFSLEDFDTAAPESKYSDLEGFDDLETRPLSAPPIDFEPPTPTPSAVEPEPPLAEFDESDLDLSDIQPFSFDEWNESDLGSLPEMPLDDEPLQPFSFDTTDVQQTAPPTPTPFDDMTLPTSNRPFSLDELSPDAIDSVGSNPPSALGRDLPPLPVDDESSGFSWQEPRSRTSTMFSRRPQEEEILDDDNIFVKMVHKKQTNALPPLDRTTSTADLDEEAMSFFSHDDVDLRPDSEEADLTPPPAITIGDSEPELTPFSLEDLGLSPDEIAILDNTSDLSSKAPVVVDDIEPELAPFSLEDLGLSPDEIDALNSDAFATSAPPPVTPVAEAEQELTPFSLEDLGLSPDEIASLNTDTSTTAAPADDALEPLTPFSLEDLGLSPDEIASLNSNDFVGETPSIPTAQEDDFGLGDFGGEDELQPFSLSDLGLSADEIASLGGGAEPFSIDDIDTSIVGGEEGSPQIRPSADAIFEALLAIGKRQGFVDLTDIIARYDDPEAHADEIDSIALELYRNGIAIHDGDEVIDMEEMLTEYDDSGAGAAEAEAEPELTPFSLADLGLSDDEIASLDMNNDGEVTAADFPDVTPATASDEPEMTPFSLADLGLSDDEIAEFGGGTEPSPASDEPEMTPFSLADLGLTDDEIASLDMNNDGEVTHADFPDVTPATASDEPEMTPFSLADLGLTDDEIAEFGDGTEPTPVSDEPEMTPFSLADLGLTDDEIASLGGTAEPTFASDEPEMTPFSLADLGLTDDEIASLDMNNDGEVTHADFPDVTPATAEPSEPDMTPFSLADLGLTDDEIAGLGGTDEPTFASDEPEMTPFSLADLGLTDDEIASLDMNNDGEVTHADFPDVTPATAEPSEPELTPFSLADLGLTEEEIAELGGTGSFETPHEEFDVSDVEPLSLEDLGLHNIEDNFDDDRNLKLSAEELDSLDLALPTPDQYIEPSSVWQDAQDAVDAVIAEEYSTTEPELEPFSFEELGLSADEIASLDQGDFGDEIPSEPVVEPLPVEPQPTAFHDAPTEPLGTAPSTPSAPSALPSEAPDLSAYESQLSSDPNNHGLRLALARMQGQLGSLDAALTEYKRLIKQGQLLEEIVEDLHDLLEDTTDPILLQRIHRTLGDTYSKQGRWREAMDEYGWVLNKPRS